MELESKKAGRDGLERQVGAVNARGDQVDREDGAADPPSPQKKQGATGGGVFPNEQWVKSWL